MRPSPGLQVVSYNNWPQALAEALAEPLALPGAHWAPGRGSARAALAQSLWDCPRACQAGTV